MSNQEPTQPQNSASNSGSEENPNQAGDAATEDITRGMQNMNTQNRSIGHLINLLWELPVDSVASLKKLDLKLRDDNLLREELKFFSFLFFKEAISLYSLVSHFARKLMTSDVAEQFTRIDPPRGKLAFAFEVPTIYKTLKEVAKKYKEYYDTDDNIAVQIGAVLSNSKEWKPPGNIVPLERMLEQYLRALNI